MIERTFVVLDICLPVFAFIAFGKLLSWRGLIREREHDFLNWIVYYMALPALIFGAVSRQSPGNFLNLPFWVSSLAPPLVAAALFMGLARLLRLHGATAAAWVFGCFWANVTYMGLPLAERAFGSRGLELAAVYNAVMIPIFVVLGFSLISIYTGTRDERLVHRLKRAFVNPIVGSAILGVLVSVLHEFTQGAAQQSPPRILAAAMRISYAVVDLAGQMGLPLALMLIGASLRFKALRGHGLALVGVVAGKVLLVPALALLCIRLVYPDMSREVSGTVVLLSAMPNAVAAYVVAKRMGIDESFVASMLVVSSICSIITIPIWLLVVL